MRAFYLDKQLYCLEVAPPAETVRRPVLILPPFAEEMNKSRRQIRQLAQALAAQGYASVTLDYLGCGDSAGDFSDATLERWQQDVLRAHEMLLATHHRAPIVLALRTASLLVPTMAEQVILWHPVMRGEVWLNQFLRLRVMAEKMAGRESSSALLWQEAQTNGVVEVAGYGLSLPFMQQLKGAVLAQQNGTRYALFDVAAQVENTTMLPPAIQAFVQQSAAFYQRVQGPDYWQTGEIHVAPDLIRATLDYACKECA